MWILIGLLKSILVPVIEKGALLVLRDEPFLYHLPIRVFHDLTVMTEY